MPREVTLRRTDGTAAQATSHRENAAVLEESMAGGENTVVLAGKVAGDPADRRLPSGDVLVTWRLVVRRPPPARRAPEGIRRISVDTIDCASWRGDVRRAVHSWSDGDVVRVEGSLRRRFWRTATGTASRCEVEVTRVRRLSRANGN